jgi:hypothetical protein
MPSDIWLLVVRRVQRRANLMRRKIFDTALFEVCERNVETADHIVSGCPFCQDSLGLGQTRIQRTCHWTAPPQTTCTAFGRPASTPSRHFGTLLLAVAALEAKRWGWFSVLHALMHAKLWWPVSQTQSFGSSDCQGRIEQPWMLSGLVFFFSSSYAMNLMVCFCFYLKTMTICLKMYIVTV